MARRGIYLGVFASETLLGLAAWQMSFKASDSDAFELTFLCHMEARHQHDRLQRFVDRLFAPT